MLKIEVIKFEAQDVITTSVAAPTEAPAEGKCICPTDGDALCSSSKHFGPDGEVCPGEVTGYYANGNPIINHNCKVN